MEDKPMKIPWEGLIKYQKRKYDIEKGKLQSTIDELGYENSILKEKLERLEKLEESLKGENKAITLRVRTDERVQMLKKENKALQDANKSLRKNVSELLYKMNMIEFNEK